jgi:polyribonucleotide nucleotidyltransferase
MNVITKSLKLDDGRELMIETGKLAKQADGSVVVRMGNTMLLATAVAKTEVMDGIDFLPLSVDYQEKFAAAGRIPGGFLKREGKLSDYEILISRLVDRALRPIFPDDYHADTQINIQLISADHNVLPDALAGIAASAALMVSDIPFNGPMAEVRVVYHKGEFKINPNQAVIDESDLDFLVGGTATEILMVEGEANEISEELMLEALAFANEQIKKLCAFQMELASAVGRTPREYSHETHDEELKKKVYEFCYDKVYAIAAQGNPNKHERSSGIKQVKEAFIASLPEDHTYDANLISKYFGKVQKEASRNLVLDEKKRLDGRKPTEVRPIWTEVDYLPSAHGSALFTRGETQSLTTVTLGTKLDDQMIDQAMQTGYKKFILHYNFPGFSTGEVKPNRGPGRREVGHGNLAMRALKKVLPSQDENPYTIRIVSDILESNGSSSMATVCAGSMALMDAGIKIKAPVSGIAMGMISDSKTGKYTVLTDILGDEDHLGDMDFKVTGTSAGITACQMDMKVEGLSFEVLKEALLQAKDGRLHILNEMNKAISAPRAEYKETAPRFANIKIEREMIGAVIGPGGKVVQEIQKETGATIVIEENEEGGLVSIFAVNKDALEAAMRRVKAIVAQPELGEVYNGKVKSIQPYGAFVEILPGKDGLLHISEITWERLEKVEGVLEVGQIIKVKLIEIDKRTGKYKLSAKVLLPKP